MSIFSQTFLAIFVVSLISVVGAFLVAITHTKIKNVLIHLVGFSAGALLGDVFLHLLPEATENGLTVELSFAILFGILSGFMLEKVVCWRHCHLPVTKTHVHNFAIMNLFGDFMHNFIDGLVIAASFSLNAGVGMATTLAVVIHEIPQEIGDFGVLLHGGFSKINALKLNLLTACSAFLGAIFFFAFGFSSEKFLPFFVALAAGNFIYIAGSDLIPELHKDESVKNGFVQLFFILAGIAVMFLFLGLEG